MRVLSWVTPRAAEYISPPLAAVVWYLVPRLRRVTRLNLRAVYPNLDSEQRNKIARASMTHYVRGVFEAGMLWHWPLGRLFDFFDEVERVDTQLRFDAVLEFQEFLDFLDECLDDFCEDAREETRDESRLLEDEDAMSMRLLLRVCCSPFSECFLAICCRKPRCWRSAEPWGTS